MATYGQADVEITVGATSMKGHTQSMGDSSVEATTEQTDTFGDSWEEHSTTGIKKMAAFDVEGVFDDTATTGPNAKYGGAAIGTTVAVVQTFGGSVTRSFSAIITKFDIMPRRGAKTRYKATLLPTGAVT